MIPVERDETCGFWCCAQRRRLAPAGCPDLEGHSRTAHRLDPSRLNHFGRSVHLWTMVTVTGSAMETSAGLMRLAAEGDEVAFARIVEAHHVDMTRVCFVVTGGDAELTAE